MFCLIIPMNIFLFRMYGNWIFFISSKLKDESYHLCVYKKPKTTPLKYQYLKSTRVQFLVSEQQQLCYFRLFIEKLPAHPDYKSLGASKEKTNNKQVCINVVLLYKLYLKRICIVLWFDCMHIVLLEYCVCVSSIYSLKHPPIHLWISYMYLPFQNSTYWYKRTNFNAYVDIVIHMDLRAWH